MTAESLDLLVKHLTAEAGSALHTVLGMVELAAEGPLNPTQKVQLDVCRSGADRLLGVVDEVRTLMRQPAEPRRAQLFAMRDLVHGVASLAHAVADRAGSFHASVDPALPEFFNGDREGLEAMLARILMIALRISSGSVTLAARPLAAKPGVAFELDSGEPAAVARLLAGLDPAAPLDPQDVAASISMRIAGRILARMGGAIETDEDGGMVRLTVPLVAAPAATSIDQPVRGEARPVRPLDLLLAEDCDDNFRVIQAYLSSGEDRLTRVSNGAEAVEMAKRRHFDLILMDIYMPALTGYEATREIRMWETETGQQRTPIVLLSAEELQSQMQNGAAVGCSGYLVKPVSKARLLETIHQHAV
jgi:CheY-like chemotaxis protein